jgi:hypothetical protein
MRLIQRLIRILQGETAIVSELVEDAADMPSAAIGRTKLPDRRPSVRQRMKWQDGRGSDHFADVSFGFDMKGAIREVFCLANKDGSDMQGLVHDACIAASLALQHGARIQELAKSFGELREEDQKHGRPLCCRPGRLSHLPA